MRSITFLFLLTAILFGSSCSEDVAFISTEELEQSVFDAVNNHRLSERKNALILSEYIRDESRNHSQDMANGLIPVSHNGYEDRYLRITATLGGSDMSENVTIGYDNAEEALKSWLKNTAYKENIEGNYTHTGIGVWQNAGGEIFITQIFLKI